MEEQMHRDLGRHDAKIESLEERMEGVEKKLDQVLSVLAEARGGWKTLMLVAGVSGTVGALAAKIAGVLHLVKP